MNFKNNFLLISQYRKKKLIMYCQIFTFLMKKTQFGNVSVSYYLFLWPCTSSTNLSGFREWPCTSSTKLSRFPLWYIQFLVCSTFIDHEIRQFGSQFDWKSKTSLFTFLNVYVFWIERDKILISQVSPLKFRYFTDQNGPKRGPYKNEFWHFSNTEMNITNS